MSWEKLLTPNLILADSILGLTPDIIERHQLQGLVLDVDETLIAINQRQLTDEVKRWVEATKATVPISLVSNNISHERIRRIAEILDLPFVSQARKPSRRKLHRVATAMDLPFERIAMVGDRLFTDVLAGNRVGLFTILVEPMVDPLKGDPKQLIRNAEAWLSGLLGGASPKLDRPD
ncbi:YqeG family HAD IIIA-type phosphatase [Romeria aff. gracilis LEGE 07310]|uniref:YqeG family HAD IIIA-type phosphatase n=1 Tax=Vasconcelosia minhoensis LEGE 07310 TaxID=915328 RepID=A0A8J7AL83_9CYAN|nr:YqeG family HAD IIIA-type phosphatase [Romeria gracilis]MBE9077115.1 YqeG family HAD IIIA-type phosphatase [Romeria aff. gracilis LEGE 07310]